MAGDMILDNIEEYLFDEDRVVSYKWLSRTLSLHVNHAKRKLEEFADLWREKEKSKPITLTFFVSGTQETTSGNELNKVAIVKEGDLENVKKSLKKTLCEHIYSIQKTTLKDTSTLYQTDFDNTKQNLLECNKYSAISCKAAKARSVDTLVAHPVNQVSNGISGHQEKSEIPKKVLSTNDRKKTQGLAAFLTKSKTESKPAVTTEETSKDATVKQKSSAPKVGSLMHAFQSSQKAPKTSPPKEKSRETASSSKEEGDSKKKSDETTSKKPGERVSEKAENALSEKSEGTSDKKDKMMSASKEKECDKTDQPVKASSPKTEKTKDKTVDSKKATKRGISNADPGSKENDSKRRRVRMEESSSSEDEESDVDLLEQQEEEEEEMDDTPIPPTPEARSKSSQKESQKSPPQGKDATRPKGRKKVWKKKRYLDDDGCMVTENVMVSESDGGSEDEDETAPSAEKLSPSGSKKETSPSSDKGSKKTSPPSSGRKQTALTSFFKKK